MNGTGGKGATGLLSNMETRISEHSIITYAGYHCALLFLLLLFVPSFHYYPCCCGGSFVMRFPTGIKEVVCISNCNGESFVCLLCALLHRRNIEIYSVFLFSSVWRRRRTARRRKRRPLIQRGRQISFLSSTLSFFILLLYVSCYERKDKNDEMTVTILMEMVIICKCIGCTSIRRLYITAVRTDPTPSLDLLLSSVYLYGSSTLRLLVCLFSVERLF